MVIVREENSYRGIIEVGSRAYIYVIDTSDSKENQGSLNVDWRLKLLLRSSLSDFLKCNKFDDPCDFHNRFCEFVKEKIGDRIKCETWIQNPLKMCAIIKNLKEDIERVGEFVGHINLEKGIVEIELKDSQQRDHKATLKLSSNYPRDPLEIVSHDLPLHGTTSENVSDFSNIYSVSEFCKKFHQLVNSFQEFWHKVTMLDSQCCVLDPPNPTFKNISRRIKLTDTLSVSLTFNPFVASQRPNILLLGCQTDVNYYNTILQKNLENDLWDCEEDYLYNLSNLLQINIPTKMFLGETDVLKSNGTIECAICFTWRLNDEIPNEVCEKETCKSVYHSVCLFTYLSSVLKNRNYFNKIQGECPNCDEIISCNIPKFK